MQNNVVETVLGAVVLAVTALFLTFAYKVIDLAPVEGYEIEARFSRIDGLNTGSHVKLSGVRVGRITGFYLDTDTYEAVVKMDIQGGIKLPLDTSATIASEGLMGGKYLALEVGGDDLYIEPGGRIEYTQTPPGLEQMLGQVIFSMSKGKDDSAKE
ncbi:MAG: outer membrane lipid asymmetry maintenance protein MlaD [Micavibrio sp.]|nr:MAG: outer membrane lipid asymmetry maintenance protein MlaD [Micavibrio sp.]